jgi:phosphoglycerate dehydrogenase-like enzyme
MASFSVHIPDAPDRDELERLRVLVDAGVELTVGPDLPADPSFRVLVDGLPSAEELDASPGLRVLLIPWAGLPRATRELMLERPGIAVHNIHHNAVAASELAAALLLAAAKRVVPLDAALRMNDWRPRYEPGQAVILRGKRALVLGYGAVGRRIAAICRGLGMPVSAIRRRPGESPADGPDEVHGPDALHALLPEADALVIALPLTEATRGLIGERELKLLPRDAIVVNVGRGRVVDERAFYEALATRSIRAAGIDVWYHYPASEDERASTPPSAFPFSELPNVVMSPHRAGAFGVGELEAARTEAIADAINAAARGDPIPFPVDVEAGY